MLILLINILFFSFILFTINGKLCIKLKFYDFAKKKVAFSGAALMISLLISLFSLFTISNGLIKVVPLHNMTNAITIIAIACVIGLTDDIKKIKFKLRKNLQYLIGLLIALNTFAFAEGKLLYILILSASAFFITIFMLNIFYSTKNGDNVNTTTTLIIIVSLMQLAHLAGTPVITIISFVTIPVFLSALFYDRIPSKMNYGTSGAYIIASLLSILLSYFADLEIKGVIIPILAMMPIFSDNIIIAIENKIQKGSFFISENKNLFYLMWKKTDNLFSLLNYLMLFIICFISGVATINTGIHLIAYITAALIIPITYILRRRYS